MADTATEQAAPTASGNGQTIDPAEYELLKTQLAERTNLLNARNVKDQELRELVEEIEASDDEIADLDEKRKAAKKMRETRIGALQLAIKRRDRKDRQKELPLEDDGKPVEPKADTKAATVPAPDSPIRSASVVANDEGALHPITELGLSEGWTEKLTTAGLETVGKIEWAMANGKLTPGEIKGIGERAINAIHEKLTAFRADHPVPEPAENPQNQTSTGATSAPQSETAESSSPPATSTDAPTISWTDPDGKRLTVPDPDAPQTVADKASQRKELTDDQEWKAALVDCDRLIPKAHILTNKLDPGPELDKVIEWHKELIGTRQWIADSEDVTAKMLRRIPEIDSGLVELDK